MSDVNANINISIDSSQALGQLRALQDQISNFNRSVITGNVAAAQAQKDLTRNLVSQINATKGFTTSIANVESSVSRLGKAIDKNKLSLGEYFRYGVVSSGVFGKSMKEHAEIMGLAEERVKRLQTRYIALEQAHNGYTRSLAVRPTSLFNADSAIAIQRQQIFNKLLGDGSTALVNWGKNTQWAGRQLMVGFTVPLTIFGGMAGKIFMDLEKQVVQFKRVYGDLTTSTNERNAMVEEVKAMGKEFTKYGITVADTVALAAKAAATGATGADLIAQTTEATRLATLGQIDYQQALDATISLQTAFGISSKNLADATNFLNAVENQTVTSLDDITQAIPLVAPVIKGLGGDVKDLAIFMTAMREGGISANEGANALKSGLASLINPTKAAREQLAAVGINIDTILSKNKGDLRGLITEFGTALGTLGKFERQQTLAKMFGKYQFARMGALFANIAKEGSQAQRVVDLTALSAKELGQIAEGELGQLEEAVGVKFTAAVEKLKLAIAPIGEAFLKIATPIIEWVTKIAEKFNELPDAAKTFLTWGAAIGGVLVPTIIMLVGLLGNFAGNMLKIGAAIGRLMGKTSGLSSGLEYLTMEELDALAASSALEGQTNTLTSALNVQRTAVKRLTSAYGNYVSAAGAAAANIPQGFRGGPQPIKMASGGLVPGTGNTDKIPALLTPGESVINKKATKKFGPILSAMNNGSIPGFVRGQIDIGNGEVLNVDFRSVEGDKSSFAAVQRLFDSIGDDAVEAKEAFRVILRDLQTAKGVTAEQVRSLLRATRNPQLSRLGNETRASYPGTETPSVQLARQTAMSADEIAAEVRVAQVSADGASRAVTEWANANHELIQQLGYDVESFVVESNIARAHTQRVEKGAGIAAWHANFWQMQSQAENQFIETGLKQSKRNQEFLMRYLGSQEEAEALMKRLVSGVALTEDEYDRLNAGLTKMLQAVERTPEILITGNVSPTFLKQAIGAKGAIDARRNHPERLRYADPRSLAGMTEAELAPLVMERTVADVEESARNVAESHSNAEAFARVGDDIDGGLAEGITRSTPVVTAAAERLTETTKATVATGAKDISKEFEKLGITGGTTATTPRSVAMQIEAEKQARQEALKRRAVEAAINKEVQRRQMLLVRSGIPAQAALVIARKQVLAEREELLLAEKNLQIDEREAQLATAAQGGGGTGGTGKPVTGGTGSDGPITSEDGKPAKKGLKSFAGKLMGASFALDGLVFGMSMMDNGIGEFAQKIMPAVFGLQTLIMMGPMLANPIGAVAAGLAASAAAVWVFKSKADEMSAAAQKFADSMISTQSTVDKIGEFYGKQSLAKKQSSDIIREQTGAKNADIEKAREFAQSEVGQSMQEGLSLAIAKVGAGPAAKQFSANLGSMILQGVMSPKEAQAVAMTMGEALGNQQFGIDVNGSLKTLLGPKNENLLKRPLKLAIEVNQQNAKSVESLGVNISDLSSQIEGFNEWKMGDAVAASINPVYGLFNAINKATLGWDNWIGQVARSARGILNPDDFENVEASLKSIGSLAGNQMAQAYDNLSAAKARYKDISEKAAKIDEKDVDAKKRAARAAKTAERDLKNLTKQVKEQQTEIFTMFSGAADQAKVSILEGMRESISKQFENDPAMKFAWDMINGQMKDVSQDVQFNINMGISSGVLNPIGIQSLMGMFANPTEASATINFLITTYGLGETNQMILDILNIKDETIRKEAIIDLILNTPGGLDQETLDLLDPTGEISKEVGVKTARPDVKGAKERADRARTALDDYTRNQDYSYMPEVVSKRNANQAAKENLSATESRERDRQRILAESQGEIGLSADEIDKRVRATEAYQKALAEVTYTQKELDAAVQAAGDGDAELKRLTEENTRAQEEYNKALATSGPISADAAERATKVEQALLPLRTEFRKLADIAQQGKNGIEIEIDTSNVSENELKSINEDLEIFNKLPKKALKAMGVETIGSPEQLDEITRAYEGLESKKPKVVKQAVLAVGTAADPTGGARKAQDELAALGYSMAQFAALDNTMKYNILANIEAKINLEANIGSLTAGLEQAKASGDGRIVSMINDRLSTARSQLADIVSQLTALKNLDTGGGPTLPTTPSGGSSGGGGDKAQPLKDLWKGMIEQIKLYGNVNASMKMLNGKVSEFLKLFKMNKGIADELAAAGYSPQFIEQILGLGSAAAKKFAKLGVGKNGQMTQYGKRRQQTSVLADIQPEIQRLQNQKTYQNVTKPLAMGVLKNNKYGLSEEMIKSFGEDEAIVNRIAGLKSLGKKGIPELEKYLKLLKQTYETNADPMQEAIDKLNKSHDDLVDKIDEEIQGYQEQIDAINDQIEAKQRLNDADQETIDGLNRQKEMIQRQIDALERANEMDQRKIDSLQREDELRQRVSDALQRDLDLMSRSEQSIRDSYQKRIDALDRVSKINDQILQSQRDQIDISRALSEGDIYAAAQAANQMQQNQVQFAAQANRDAMQQGMENQIGGLRTSSGLTRAQAEAQIQAIQDQSYQTQLAIRDIQDRIYQRNLKMLPLKDAQYQLDLQMRDIEDIIYNRNLEISALEKNIVPLQDRIDKQNDLKDIIDKQLQTQIKQLEASKDNISATDEQIAAANALAETWAEVERKIVDANIAAKKQRETLGKAPERKTYKTDEDWRAALVEWQEKSAKITSDRKAAIDAAYATVNKYAGGKIMKYAAAGSVIGSGARDSVPSMLTPGEYVIRRSMVDKYGLPFFESINQGSFSMPTYSGTKMSTTKMAAVQPTLTTVAPVYNTYSVNVPVNQPGASADEIANRVIMKIKNIESGSIRRISGY